MPKVKKPAAWWKPPRGTERWLLAMVDYVQEEHARRLANRSGSMPTEQLERLEEQYGEHDRRFEFLCALTSNIENDRERARVRLWLSEGWVPPEAPPKR